MVWFAFGTKPESWVVANGTLLDYQNMPENYEGKFKMNEWNANTIGNIGTGGDGYYWVYLRADGYAAYGTTDLIPLVKVDFLGRGRPEHIAYGPGGMWFARFKGISIEAKTTIWGPATEKAEPPIYSSTWVDLVEELRAAPNIPKDEGCVDFVTFGCHEQLIVRFENGNTLMYVTDDPEVRAKCSEGVITLVTERIADGWTVGNGTTLCQYDPEQYVIEWKKGTQTYYTFNIGTEENTTRVKNVVTLVGHDAAAQATMDSAAIISATLRATQASRMWY